ncbi:MAG: hypothetical protein EXR54_09395 [Dehalococcoidia bacterium]|nr:hypothetical protein [Dehalococcoidia bacterium]MSQ17753.1 hypothetical protein [Dehalococcoidia bacterium]
MTAPKSQPYLKYAVFCREAEDAPDGTLTIAGVVDLLDLPAPAAPAGAGVMVQVDLQLAFCIGGATPGPHRLMVGVKAPGLPLDLPPTQRVDWEEGILFQRWIKTFRIPVQRPGLHVAAILLDGVPLGEASFLVRFKNNIAVPG